MRIESELKNDAIISIGLVNSKNYDQHILYEHHVGQISDNEFETKIINRKLKKDSIITFTYEIVKKTLDDKKIFQVNININEDEKFVSFMRLLISINSVQMYSFIHN